MSGLVTVPAETMPLLEYQLFVVKEDSNQPTSDPLLPSPPLYNCGNYKSRDNYNKLHMTSFLQDLRCQTVNMLFCCNYVSSCCQLLEELDGHNVLNVDVDNDIYVNVGVDDNVDVLMLKP